MADSAVPISGGSGYNVDTRTESTAGDHRQVVVLGDPVDGSRVAAVSPTGDQLVQVRSEVLELVLRELQRHSIYLSILTGTEVKDSDLGDTYV